QLGHAGLAGLLHAEISGLRHEALRRLFFRVEREEPAAREVMTLFLTAALALAWGAPATPELHVAAASNLNRVLAEIATAFEHETHIHVVPSFGATAQLEQQIENGSPVGV